MFAPFIAAVRNLDGIDDATSRNAHVNCCQSEETRTVHTILDESRKQHFVRENGEERKSSRKAKT